jgi:DNA-binding NarL/FixJ family response regulator
VATQQAHRALERMLLIQQYLSPLGQGHASNNFVTFFLHKRERITDLRDSPAGRGLSVSELATELNVSVKTIETYQIRIKEKVALRNAAELRQKAREWLA